MLELDPFKTHGPYLAVLALLALPACGDDTGETGGEDATEGPASTGTDTTMGPGTTAVVDESGTSGESSGSSDTNDTETPACQVAPWSAPDWDVNAASSLALRAQLDMLTGDPTMRGAETGAVVVDDVSVLTDAWEAGDPSLASVANPGFDAIVQDVFEEFVEVIAAGDQDLMDGSLTMWMPGPDGGIWGDSDRGINEGGFEVRQLVDKGGYSGGINYAYAMSLTTGDVDAATIDAIAAIWGTNADLDGMGELTDGANYSYQMGFHGPMAEALAAAKSYAGDPACTAERDEALVSFFRLWEQSMLARLVFYGNRAAGKLLMAADQSGFADVLHDLGEGLGLVVGFYGLPDPGAGPLGGAGRIITDADIEAIADAFGLDLGDIGASSTGTFLESLPEYEAAVDEAEDLVMGVYGVDAATIQGWAMPTPG
ncbi:hypothetical protein [Paraliomyxa miuraensis]|uniref:hypothetical protein n=1 Tax=Paraliomyxa miuraensis TaxID=376150 RepID=UPI00224C8C2D|nr:hypothetical protein [Paraliomyxa miuraensis]MCX4242475.1 hypothetical protein [Paraliomyxa miuraensis]